MTVKIEELKKIRNYFLEHDKTTFEHHAHNFLNDLIDSLEISNRFEQQVIPKNAELLRNNDLLNTIMVGDAEAKLREIPDNFVNLIFTSPPYNVGIEYDNYNDNQDFEVYLAKLERMFVECIRVLSEGGHLVIQIGNLFKNPYIPLTDYIVMMLKDKANYKGEIIWDKGNTVKNTAWGSWLSANKPSTRDTHEYLLIFRKDGERIGESDITSDEFIEYTKGIWRVKPETTDVGHPAPFPKELAMRVIKLYSFKHETILDPFCGSGTTCDVAKKLGRNYIGIDLSKRYSNLAFDRLNTLL